MPSVRIKPERRSLRVAVSRAMRSAYAAGRAVDAKRWCGTCGKRIERFHRFRTDEVIGLVHKNCLHPESKR